MRKQRDCAVVVGLAGVDMDQLVQCRRSGHQIDQQNRADDQRNKQPSAQWFQTPGSLIQTIPRALAASNSEVPGPDGILASHPSFSVVGRVRPLGETPGVNLAATLQAQQIGGSVSVRIPAPEQHSQSAGNQRRCKNRQYQQAIVEASVGDDRGSGNHCNRPRIRIRVGGDYGGYFLHFSISTGMEARGLALRTC